MQSTRHVRYQRVERLWTGLKNCVKCLRTQQYLVHHCSVIFERRHMWKHQFTGRAPGMRTWNWVIRGKSFQVSLNLIHHLVGPSVLSRPPLIGLAFIAETEYTLRRLTHQRKAVMPVFFRVLRGRLGRDHRFSWGLSRLWPATSTLLSGA